MVLELLEVDCVEMSEMDFGLAAWSAGMVNDPPFSERKLAAEVELLVNFRSHFLFDKTPEAPTRSVFLDDESKSFHALSPWFVLIRPSWRIRKLVPEVKNRLSAAFDLFDLVDLNLDIGLTMSAALQIPALGLVLHDINFGSASYDLYGTGNCGA